MSYQGAKGERGPMGVPGPQGLSGTKGDKVCMCVYINKHVYCFVKHVHHCLYSNTLHINSVTRTCPLGAVFTHV